MPVLDALMTGILEIEQRDAGTIQLPMIGVPGKLTTSATVPTYPDAVLTRVLEDTTDVAVLPAAMMLDAPH